MKPESDADPVIGRFIQDVEAISWFKNVGQPLPPDTNAQRLHGWEDWPGPEEPAIFELAERLQALHDSLLASAEERRDELKNLWERISETVIRRAGPTVPYDASEDAWHGPNAAVWQASFTAGLVAWCLLLRRQMPASCRSNGAGLRSATGHQVILWCGQTIGLARSLSSD